MQDNKINTFGIATSLDIPSSIFIQDITCRIQELKNKIEFQVLYAEENLILYLNNKLKVLSIEYQSIKGLSFIEISISSQDNYLYEIGTNNQVISRFEYIKGINEIGKTLNSELNSLLFNQLRNSGLVPHGCSDNDNAIKNLLEVIYEALNSGDIKNTCVNKFLEWKSTDNIQNKLNLSDEEKEEYINLLKRENLLYYAKTSMEEKDINKSIIGEYHSSLTLFLNCVGALNGIETLNTLKGSSSIGKTAVANMVTGLFNTKKVGDLSPTALKHGNDYEDYDVLYLQESLENDFEQKNFRFLSSDDGGFIAETTIKDKETGEFEVRQSIVPAKTLVTTSTVINVHDEFSTRSYIIPLDESSKQTQKIVEHNFSESSRLLDFITGRKKFGKKYSDLKKALTLLKQYQIIIPYEEDLGDIFSFNQNRARRDSRKFTQLIKCSAFLFQYQRPKTEINGFNILVATIQDLYNVLRIAGPILESTLTGFDTRVFQAMEVIPGIVKKTGYVTSKILDKEMEYGSNYASQILKILRDNEFLVANDKLKEELNIKGRIIVHTLNPEYKSENLISSIKDLNWLKLKSKEEEIVTTYIKSSSNYKGLTYLYDVIENKQIPVENNQIENIPNNHSDTLNQDIQDTEILNSDFKDSRSTLEQLSIEAFVCGNEKSNERLGQLLLKKSEEGRS